MADPSVIILTFNEALHLDRAIQSLGSLPSEIIVRRLVFHRCNDRNRKNSRARIFQRRFRNQSDQFQWALDNMTARVQLDHASRR